jgi:hypothetical protein
MLMVSQYPSGVAGFLAMRVARAPKDELLLDDLGWTGH